jgi:hypothetical protein
MKKSKISQLHLVGDHQNPPRRRVGLHIGPKFENPQLQRSIEECFEIKIVKRSQLE